MASAASACRLIKNVVMNKVTKKTNKTMNIETSLPCKKKLIVATIPAKKKCEHMR